MRRESRSYAMVVLCFAFTLSGQTPTGAIQGVVQDSSGAAVPEARIIISNVATNEVKELRTDATGRYLQPFLLTGFYNVAAEKQGFRAVKRESIKLDVGQNRSVDFSMEVGAPRATATSFRRSISAGPSVRWAPGAGTGTATRV